MAYNLTTGSPSKPIITIADGTIDTTSTSLAIPGRNYSGYGQPVDQDLIRLMEHFASSNEPNNAIQGQLWYQPNTITSSYSLSLCIGEANANANATWATILTNPVNGNLQVNGNLGVAGNIVGNGNLVINSPGQIFGQLASPLTFSSTGNGATPPGSYNAGNPLTVSYNTVGAARAVTGAPPPANAVSYAAAGIDDGAGTRGMNPTTGVIYGAWTLAPGSTFNATYADLAERFESDAPYDAGTVVELGGEREITAVREELSDRVFGVVSDRAAFTMNGAAGPDATHPAVAISGRVPVKVVGTVRKGDRLVSAGGGRARAAKKEELTAFNTIGRALTDKGTTDAGTVLAIVTIK